jgi:AcrR family transcriptional regulator
VTVPREPRVTRRRDQLAQAATDYVLEHGLVGLSLRPLAAAIGTSDRMLLYHFDGKADLVATVLRVSNDRSVEAVRSLPPSADVRSAVGDLWRAVTAPGLLRCQQMYVEAAALGLFGSEPYASAVAEANAVWVAAVSAHLEDAGVSGDRAARATAVLDAAFSGFLLDLPLHGDPAAADAVDDLAEAVAVIASG